MWIIKEHNVKGPHAHPRLKPCGTGQCTICILPWVSTEISVRLKGQKRKEKLTRLKLCSVRLTQEAADATKYCSQSSHSWPGVSILSLHRLCRRSTPICTSPCFCGWTAPHQNPTGFFLSRALFIPEKSPCKATAPSFSCHFFFFFFLILTIFETEYPSVAQAKVQ